MKWKLALLSIVISLVAGEIIAHIVLRGSAESGFRDAAGFYQYHLNLTKWEGGNWLRELVPHPYFGYVLSPENSAVNNYGFQDPSAFPYLRKSKNDFVVSVLGGSVAMGWAGWAKGGGNEFFISELKRRVPSLAARNIVILNMAMGGYKQPQQLNIAAYFLDSVDLFINLEGHNELNASSNKPVFPMDFPIGAYLYFWQSRQAVEASRELKILAAVNHKLIYAGASNKNLAKSALYFSFAKFVFQFVAQRSRQLADYAKANLEKELSEPRRSYYGFDVGNRDHVATAIAVWERFAIREQRLVSALGGKVIFFLQPNQYMPGSKPFSDWEQKNAISKDFLRKAKEYELLPKAVQRMRNQGVNIHDLTMIYSREPETIYSDRCCHVNELGNRIMSSAIASKIGQSLKFR